VFDPYVLALSTIGVGFISASANTVNQFLEVPFDSQMNRTKNRVLVRGLLMPRHALTFAAMSGVTGTLFLVNYANPLAAGLGLFNLILYTR
jgi:protoheme IX farnesyltransferase